MELLYTDRWENCCGETIVERHYRLTIAGAERELRGPIDHDRLNRVVERAGQLPGGWVKRIDFQAYRDDNLERRWTSCSPRPYVQGYGCDGQTDECIHLLAFTLARRLGLDYGSLYARAYPDQEIEAGWSETLERVHGETIVPDEIDPLLVLDDLMDVNNYDLAHVLGDEWIARGLIPESWAWIRSGEEFRARQEQALRRAWQASVQSMGKPE